MQAQSPTTGDEKPSNESAPAMRTSSSLVTPHPLKWHQRLAASAIYGLIEAVSLTQRYQWDYHAEVLRKEIGPVIFCIWHNRLPFSLIMYRHYARRKRQPHQMAAIVSASKDGGVVARVLEHFGVQPVRGSSSRRGKQALLELTTWAERGYDLAITPDGPRGPAERVQPGAIAAAQHAGVPIVAVGARVASAWYLGSWDRMCIPKPFATIDVVYAPPVEIDAGKEGLRRGMDAVSRSLHEVMGTG